VTSRGMGPAEMELIGRWIDEGIQAVKARDEATLDRIAAEVAELAAQFPALVLYPWVICRVVGGRVRRG
jgi:glycine hydroxymethyltransferase